MKTMWVVSLYRFDSYIPQSAHPSLHAALAQIRFQGWTPSKLSEYPKDGKTATIFPVEVYN